MTSTRPAESAESQRQARALCSRSAARRWPLAWAIGARRSTTKPTSRKDRPKTVPEPATQGPDGWEVPP